MNHNELFHRFFPSLDQRVERARQIRNWMTHQTPTDELRRLRVRRTPERTSLPHITITVSPFLEIKVDRPDEPLTQQEPFSSAYVDAVRTLELIDEREKILHASFLGRVKHLLRETLDSIIHSH